jgi:hypothetical protein
VDLVFTKLNLKENSMISDEILAKAKCRIKRQILTGEKQHRVSEIKVGLFSYDVKHHSELLMFRVDKIGRLYLQKGVEK